MEAEFIPYELALDLKELGFDEPCLLKDTEQGEDCAVYYVHENGRPTFSQCFRWFREKHNLCGYTVTAPNYIKGESKYKTRFSYEIYGMNEKSSSTVFISIRDLINVSTHEEAELECLKKLIEIVKLK
jgi:hypothetical protein